MLPIVLGGPPLADFTQPLAMLADCHRRIEHFLDVQLTVLQRFGDGELNEEGRQALEKSLTYFEQAAPRHTADEEESLFPRMRRSDDSTVQAAFEELDRLEGDHRRAETLHDQVEVLGRRWLETGRLDPADRVALETALDELSTIYAAHIPLEEERVFGLAAQVLNAEELRQVGEEMKRRRTPPLASHSH